MRAQESARIRLHNNNHLERHKLFKQATLLFMQGTEDFDLSEVTCDAVLSVCRIYTADFQDLDCDALERLAGLPICSKSYLLLDHATTQSLLLPVPLTEGIACSFDCRYLIDSLIQFGHHKAKKESETVGVISSRQLQKVLNCKYAAVDNQSFAEALSGFQLLERDEFDIGCLMAINSTSMSQFKS